MEHQNLSSAKEKHHTWLFHMKKKIKVGEEKEDNANLVEDRKV